MFLDWFRSSKSEGSLLSISNLSRIERPEAQKKHVVLMEDNIKNLDGEFSPILWLSDLSAI